MSELNKNIGDKQNELARSLAAITSPELNGALETVLKAKEDLLAGPFAIIKAMQDTLGDRFDELPVPGEKEGNNPAIYKAARTDNRTGKSVLRDENFYNVYADSLPEGLSVIKELKAISLSRDVEANHTSIPKNIMDMTPQEKNVREGYLTGRKSTIRAKVLAAVELQFQFAAIKSLPGVDAEPFMNEQGVIDNSTTPIHVFNPKNEKKEWKAISISSFMKLNADKAREKGGSYAALFETIKRKKDDKTTPTSVAAPQQIATLDTFKARMNDMHSYMDEVWSATDKARYNELLKLMGPKSPAGNGDFKLNVYAVYTMLGDIFRHDAIRAHVDALKEQDAVGTRDKAA